MPTHARTSIQRRQRKTRHRGQLARQTRPPDRTRPDKLELDAPSAQMRQAAVSDAGQQHGNQFVLRLLAGAATIQRQPETPPTVTGAALVGLKRGDGLDVGTFDKRQRVILLQQKLNEKMKAGLKPDGKFGAKTEQILREFQESMELPGSDVVNQATADLLMTESTPARKQEEVPAEEQARVQTAGQSMTETAEQLKKVAARHVAAGMKMGRNTGNGPLIGGALFEAGSEIAECAFRLEDAAKLLSVGDLKSVVAAGPKLQLSGKALQRAAEMHKRAADLFAETNNRAYKVAGVLFTDLAAATLFAGQNIERAGLKLKSYQPPDIPGKQIGDPLVGLAKGDGIIFGTWERRPRVKELQILLVSHGVGPLKDDGKFGDDTATALHLFQFIKKRELSDRVDRVTAQALRKAPGTDGQAAEDGLAVAGSHLKAAGEALAGAENLLLGGALAIRSGPGPGDKEASERLRPGSKELAKAGEALAKAGQELAGPEKPAK